MAPRTLRHARHVDNMHMCGRLAHACVRRCGHSKKLAPAYDALGAAFAAVPTVTIARMDGSANEVPGLDYEGYPSLLLVTASNRRFDVGDRGSARTHARCTGPNALSVLRAPHSNRCTV